MQVYTIFPALVLIATLFVSSEAGACARPRLHGLRFDGGHTVTARLDCLDNELSGLGLNPTDYTLLVDELNPVQGQHAVVSAEPIDLVVVIQISPVMEPAIAGIKKALHDFAKVLTAIPGSAGSLITYSTDARTVASLGNVTRFEMSIEKVAVDSDSTEVRLLAALDKSYAVLKARPSERRKFLVVFSDGIDEHMGSLQVKRAFSELGSRMQAAGIVALALNYAPFEPERLAYLKMLIKSTGGRWRDTTQPTRIDAECESLQDAMRQSLLITFPLPQELNADHAQFVVMHKSGAMPSNPIDSNVPFLRPSLDRWMLWLSAGGVVVSIVLLATALLRRMARERVATPSLLTANKNTAQGKTTMIHQGKQIAVAWVVKLHPQGKHETIPVGDVLTLGESPHRCQISKLEDGFELIELDGDGLRRRINDGQGFGVGGEPHKFKSVVR